MKRRGRFVQPVGVLVVAVFASVGCGGLPGRPQANSIPVDPDKVSNFMLLFQQNCSGCHGVEGCDTRSSRERVKQGGHSS